MKLMLLSYCALCSQIDKSPFRLETSFSCVIYQFKHAESSPRLEWKFQSRVSKDLIKERMIYSNFEAEEPVQCKPLQ